MYWNYDSWGADVPPENYIEICDEANSLIDKYIIKNGLDLNDPNDEADAQYYSTQLWNKYCMNGKIDN